MKLGISKPPGKRTQRQRLIIILFDTVVDFIDDDLYLPLPFIHFLFHLVSKL